MEIDEVIVDADMERRIHVKRVPEHRIVRLHHVDVGVVGFDALGPSADGFRIVQVDEPVHELFGGQRVGVSRKLFVQLVVIGLRGLLVSDEPLILGTEPFGRDAKPCVFGFAVLVELAIIDAMAEFRLRELQCECASLIPLVASGFFRYEW